MRQPDLFGVDHEPFYPAVPGHVKGSQTSKDAAESMKESAGSLRKRILAYIRTLPSGATCDEIELSLGLRHQTASARIAELKHGGKLKSIGRRPTRSGRQADVMVAA